MQTTRWLANSCRVWASRVTAAIDVLGLKLLIRLKAVVGFSATLIRA
jgi:hypothetical protein